MSSKMITVALHGLLVGFRPHQSAFANTATKAKIPLERDLVCLKCFGCSLTLIRAYLISTESCLFQTGKCDPCQKSAHIYGKDMT